MGQAKIRKGEIERLKSMISDITLFKSDELEISEILDFHQKRYWMRVYKDSYRGNRHEVGDSVITTHLKNLSDPQLYGKTVRFIKAIIDGVDVGFIRINDKSDFFNNEQTPIVVWNVTDGYIKPEYRNRSTLRKLIEFSIAKLNVKMCYMERQRYDVYKSYYESLNFTFSTTSSNGLMSWLFLEEMKSYFRIQNLNALDEDEPQQMIAY